MQATSPATTDTPLQESAEEPNKTTAAHADDRLGEMVTIPAGSFLMGNNGHEGFENPEEFPQHLVDLPAYQIGKFEVTRGQFRKFIEAGGYEDPRYWSADGWKWKESDVIDYAGMHGSVATPSGPTPARNAMNQSIGQPSKSGLGMDTTTPASHKRTSTLWSA